MKTVITIEHKTPQDLAKAVTHVTRDIAAGFRASSGEIPAVPPMPSMASMPAPMQHPPNAKECPHACCGGCHEANDAPEVEYSSYEFKTED